MLFDLKQEPFEVERKLLKSDALFEKIILTEEFNRLKHIRFMGAIDYTTKNELSKLEKSRANHSIDVAVLANYVSKKRKYSHELTKHLVIAGLLHDIGHFPLSHSLEKEIKKNIGYNHHDLGQEIITKKNNSNLSKLLSDNCDINFILDLINGKGAETDGGMLFASPINIDTIDGIHRAYKHIEKTECYDRLKVVDSAFKLGELSNIDLQTLDKFWHSKNDIYKKFIHSEYGLFSDFIGSVILEKELRQKDNIFKKDGMLKSENSWHQKFRNFFDYFKKVKKNGLIGLDNLGSEYSISFVKRAYLIDEKHQTINDRYLLTKKENTIVVKLFKQYEQLDLPYGIQ